MIDKILEIALEILFFFRRKRKGRSMRKIDLPFHSFSFSLPTEEKRKTNERAGR